MTDAQYDRLFELIELRFQQLEAKLDARMDRLEERMDRLEERMDRLEKRMNRLDQRLDLLERRVEMLHAEMLERFQFVHDRLEALERRVTQLTAGFDEMRLQLSGIRSDIDKLVVRMDRLEAGLYEQTMRVNNLADEMRQRFRVVTDRLTAVEQRLAA